VYDNDGNILAAAMAGEGADEFVLQEGEHADEFEAPEQVAEGGLVEFLEGRRVDVDSRKLTEHQAPS
jgi:hypothetical protein